MITGLGLFCLNVEQVTAFHRLDDGFLKMLHLPFPASVHPGRGAYLALELPILHFDGRDDHPRCHQQADPLPCGWRHILRELVDLHVARPFTYVDLHIGLSISQHTYIVLIAC